MARRINGIVCDTSRYVTGRYISTLPLSNSHRLLYDFADDIALIFEDMDKANEFLPQEELAAVSVELHINKGKTKVMTLNMED